MKKLPRGKKLWDLAERLGIATEKYGHCIPNEIKAETELQKRVMEYKRAIRESRLWIIAVWIGAGG